MKEKLILWIIPRILIAILILVCIYLSLVHFGWPVYYGEGDTGNAMATSNSMMRFMFPLLVATFLFGGLIYDFLRNEKENNLN